MWKLSKIDIRNFKFFKDLFQLDVNGLNLLMYGENGAGYAGSSKLRESGKSTN